MHDNNEAAFLLHQAAERFFNAIVLTFTRYKPKTHDIETLDRQASNLHADFFKVFPRATEQQKRCFDLLKKAYIDARYKRDYAITKDELEYLAGRVRKAARIDQADLRGEDCEHGVTGRGSVGSRSRWFKSRALERKALVQTEHLQPEGFLCPGSSSR